MSAVTEQQTCPPQAPEFCPDCGETAEEHIGCQGCKRAVPCAEAMHLIVHHDVADSAVDMFNVCEECKRLYDEAWRANNIRQFKEGLQRDFDKEDIATQKASTTTVTIEDFLAYMPAHNYICIPTRELWPASSVNARVPPVDTGGTKPVAPNTWLDHNRHVEQMTWAPGKSMVIANKVVSSGGWIDQPDYSCFNLYRPPELRLGDASKAGRWLEHLHRVFPESATHIVKWLAHRVQCPGEKINHALVFGGAQGIGKDTILEPVKHAVGPWNFTEITPAPLLGRFNSFVKSVILRINEARDQGEIDRYAFYEHMKVYAAAPPDVIRCDEKHLREYAVFNIMGVVLTTNHKTDGIYLPPDDRRHYVAWSALTKEDFSEDYWNSIYNWYKSGGIGHVAAYLADLDIASFDPKAPPPKTPAFWEVVDSNRAPEDAELRDVLDAVGDRSAITVDDLKTYTTDDGFRTWLTDRKNRRQLPHRLESIGYTPVRNDAADDGLWKVGSKRQVIYAKRELSVRDRLAAASTLCRRAAGR